MKYPGDARLFSPDCLLYILQSPRAEVLLRAGKSLLWLRRLNQVRAELRQERFPRSAEEGLRQCLVLSGLSLKALEESVRREHPGAGPQVVQREVSRLEARLERAGARLAIRPETERAGRR